MTATVAQSSPTAAHWPGTASADAKQEVAPPSDGGVEMGLLERMKDAASTARTYEAGYAQALEQAGNSDAAGGASVELARMRSAAATQALHAAHADLVSQAAVRAGSAWVSHRDMYARITKALGDLKGPQVEKKQEALRMYVELLHKFSASMAKLKDCVKATENKDHEGKLEVNFYDVRQELIALKNQYASKDMGRFSTQQEAREFLREGGLDANDFAVVQTGGQWAIKLPTNVIQSVIDSMPGPLMSYGPRPPNLPANKPWPPLSDKQLSGYYWDNAKYNAWAAGKDSHTEKLQHYSQVLAEYLSRSNQRWDNLNKVLSEAMQATNSADQNVSASLR